MLHSMADSLVSDASPAWGALRWLFDLVLQATLLLLLAGGITLLMRRASAALRHQVWLLALGGLLTLPLLGLFMPRHLALLSPLRAPQLAPQQQQPAPQLAPAMEAGQKAPVEASVPQQLRVPQRLDASPALPQPPSSSRSQAWALGGLALWLGGVLLAVSRVVVGLRGIGHLRRHSLPLLEGELLEQARQAQAALGCRRPVALRMALADADVVVPLTWGWRRPIVLLPSDADAWPPMRQRAVMLHELGHVARGDWAVLLVSQAACALFWFHPLVSQAARSLRAESERATDDRVLAAGMRASDYGECLLEFVRLLKATQRRPIMKWTLAMAQISTLEKRMQALLDARRDRRGISRAQVLGGMAAASAVLLSVATTGAVGGAGRGVSAASGANAAGYYGGAVTLSDRQRVDVTVGIQPVPQGRDRKAPGRSTATLTFGLPYGGLGTPMPPANRADAPLARVLFALPNGQLLPALPPFNVDQRTGAFRVGRKYSGPGWPNLGLVTLWGTAPRAGRAGTFALSLGGRVFRGELSSPGPTPRPSPSREPSVPTATPRPTPLNGRPVVVSTPTPTPVPTNGGPVVVEVPTAIPNATVTPTPVAPLPPPKPGERGTVFLSQVRDANLDATPMTGRGTAGAIYKRFGYSDVGVGTSQGGANGMVRTLGVSLYVPDSPLTGQVLPITPHTYTVGAAVYYVQARGSAARTYLGTGGTVTILEVKGNSIQIRLNNVQMGRTQGRKVVGGVGRDFLLNGTLKATLAVGKVD